MTWMLLGHLRARHIDPVAVVRSIGLDIQDLVGTDVRIPLADLHALWAAAAQAANDPALGIRIVTGLDPQATFSWPPPFSLYEHVARASATLREGITRQSKLVRLMRDGLRITLDGTHDRPFVRFDFSLASEPRALSDFQVAAGLLVARRVTGDNTGPLEVWFSAPEPKDPKDLQLYRDLFDAPLRFNAECNAIWSDAQVLDLPLPTANPMFASVLEQRGAKLVDALPALDDFVEIVRERITAELPHGNTNASCVAEKLGISPRTLHRRLQNEGTSYQDLLDGVRCRLAMQHLASRRHAINEVAHLVGFAQPSAFHRAFKSWTGETPAEYQERGLSRNNPL